MFASSGVRPLLVAAMTLVACRSGDGNSGAPGSSVSGTLSSPEAAPSASVLEPAPSASAPPVPKAPEAEYLVVWGPPESVSAPVSFLLEWRPPNLTVLGNRGGAIVFSASGLYRWQKIKGKGYGLKDCDEAWNPKENPDPENRIVIETEGAVAKRLDAPGDIQVHEPPTFEDMSSFSNSITLEASLGSYLFTHVFEDTNACTGAHPFSSHREPVFDLALKDFITYPTKEDEQLLRIEARQLAEATLAPCLQAVVDARCLPDAGFYEAPSLGAMWLDTAVPRWSKRRGLHFELILGALDCMVVGGKTCTLLVNHAPPSLEKFPLPAAFAELPKKLPGFQAAGWSVIPADDEAGLEAAKRVFEKRKKKN